MLRKKKNSSQTVTTVNPQISTGDVRSSFTEQEGDGAHEILGVTHLAGGDERGPLLLEVWVLVEDLASPAGSVSNATRING